MRSVGKERAEPRTRGGKPGRSPARGVARATAPSSGRRSRRPGGIAGRLFGFFGALINFRHPMVLISIAVIILTVAAAILAGNVIDRTVKKTDAAAGVIASHAGFGIAQLHLTGNVRTKPAEIMAALGFKAGQSIFGVNLRQARARLMALPWVADAEVKRRYPDDISVRIVERVPYARWQSPHGLVLVERQGHVITAANADHYGTLPLLLGSGAPEKAVPFVSAVARHRGIVWRVQGYQFQSHRRWNLLLNDGVIVKLPESGFEKELEALDKLIVEKGILESDIREIDMRDPAFYFFVRRNGTGEQKDRKTEAGSAI